MPKKIFIESLQKWLILKILNKFICTCLFFSWWHSIVQTENISIWAGWLISCFLLICFSKLLRSGPPPKKPCFWFSAELDAHARSSVYTDRGEAAGPWLLAVMRCPCRDACNWYWLAHWSSVSAVFNGAFEQRCRSAICSAAPRHK